MRAKEVNPPLLLTAKGRIHSRKSCGGLNALEKNQTFSLEIGNNTVDVHKNLKRKGMELCWICFKFILGWPTSAVAKRRPEQSQRQGRSEAAYKRMNGSKP